MIDERLVVLDLLDGVGINKNCIYGHCYLLAKYYLQVEGLNELDTRKKIFGWATKTKLYLNTDEINVNQIIYKAQQDKTPLREKPILGISDVELRQIIIRFNKKKTRRIALAILCYAKAAGDKDGNFNISISGLANWLHCSRSSLYEHINILKEYRFIEKQAKEGQRKSWNKKTKSQQGAYRILIPLSEDAADHYLFSNDIDTLTEECFASGSSAFKDLF